MDTPERMRDDECFRLADRLMDLMKNTGSSGSDHERPAARGCGAALAAGASFTRRSTADGRHYRVSVLPVALSEHEESTQAGEPRRTTGTEHPDRPTTLRGDEREIALSCVKTVAAMVLAGQYPDEDYSLYLASEAVAMARRWRLLDELDEERPLSPE